MIKPVGKNWTLVVKHKNEPNVINVIIREEILVVWLSTHLQKVMGGKREIC